MPGYDLFSGQGIEIGALHQPAQLSERCQVSYCDLLSKTDSAHVFPELDPAQLVSVDYLVDLDHGGLSDFLDESFDFVILNHVIEHLANPIAAVGELFRVARPAGHVVISAPDKNYTFDRPRQITSFEHLLEDFQDSVTEVCDEHYLDFLLAVKPDALEEGAAGIASHLRGLRGRREHAHVWDSASFTSFLCRTFGLLDIKADCVWESSGSVNHFEHFCVWRKR